MHSVHAAVSIDAKPEDVFAFVSDHERFLRGPGFTCRLVKQGRDERNGVGAVREVTAPGSVFTEEVIEFNPPRQFAYVVRKIVGPMAPLAPVHERGWIELSAEGRRTRVDWFSKFGDSAPIAGWVLERLAGAAIRSVFSRLLVAAKGELESGPRA
jgi:carbon monoxide dehydrogenase subunit G